MGDTARGLWSCTGVMGLMILGIVSLLVVGMRGRTGAPLDFGVGCLCCEEDATIVRF
jgi:hypothetical protein